MLSEFFTLRIINSFSLNLKLDLLNQASRINGANSIGIIGGADGPTSVIISGSVAPLFYIVLLQHIIMLAILLLAYIPLSLFLKKVKRDKASNLANDE